MRTKIFLLVTCIILILSACKKPGVGGDATITGYVHVQKWNATFTQNIGEYEGKDVYIYIIYGDHSGYDKRIKSDYRGRFEFPYLYKGAYKVYLYSRDSTFSDPSGTVAIVRDVNIEKRTETVDLDTLLIFQ